MKTINVNGVEYVEKAASADGDHVCVIADRGWIFEGYRTDYKGGHMTLADAHVVRRWDNGLGIGGLAKPEHKDDYTLDYLGVVSIAPHAVIAVIPLGW